MIRRYVMMGLLALAATPALGGERELEAQRLFHIERNKNANIVAYDAMVDTAGNLTDKDPIDVYWLKLAEGGHRAGLKGIERRMAYGIKVKEREGNRLVIEMVADIGRLITVEPEDGRYRALISIDGQRAVLEKVFIFATESWGLPKVQYIELFGRDLETAETVYEKFKP